MVPDSQTEPTCPRCAQNDRVVRLAALYLASLERKRSQGSPASQPAGRQGSGVDSPDGAALDGLNTDEFEQLAGRLAPPSGLKKATLRLVHPDLVMGAFSLVAPVFIYGIATSQAWMLFYTLPLFFGLYGIYFWQRKRLAALYQDQVKKQRREAEETRLATKRWMQARGCLRCALVFIPGGKALEAARFKELLNG